MAAAAISHSSGTPVTSIFDRTGVRYLNVEAMTSGGTVAGYDHGVGCHFGGQLPTLYHDGEACRLDLRPTGGGRYTGYDHGAICEFEIAVEGRRATVDDSGEGRVFIYSA